MLSYRTWFGVTRGFKRLFSTGSNTLGPASKQRFGGAIKEDPLLHSQGSSIPSTPWGPPRLRLPTIPQVGQPTLGEVTSRVECINRPYHQAIHTYTPSPLLTLGGILSKILQAAATTSFQPNRRSDRQPPTPLTLTWRSPQGGVHIKISPLLPSPRQIGGHRPLSLGRRQSRWRSQRLSRSPSAISKLSTRSSIYASKRMRCRTEGVPWPTEP